jgi:hypothetical protein
MDNIKSFLISLKEDGQVLYKKKRYDVVDIGQGLYGDYKIPCLKLKDGLEEFTIPVMETQNLDKLERIEKYE